MGKVLADLRALSRPRSAALARPQLLPHNSQGISQHHGGHMSTLSDTRIRHAERGDLPAILALNAQLNPSDQPLPPAEQVEQIWDEILANSIMHTFVAEQAGRVMATCVLAIIPNLTRGAQPYGLIENVVVDAHARGGGIGTLLMQGALQFAWQRQCYKVMLMTGRPQAVGFYERAGFRSHEKFGLVAKPPKAGE